MGLLTLQLQANYWRADWWHQRHISRLCRPLPLPSTHSALTGCNADTGHASCERRKLGDLTAASIETQQVNITRFQERTSIIV